MAFIIWCYFNLMGLFFPLTQKKPLPILAEIVLDIDEPSDLCMLPDESKFFIVSDKGRIFRVSPNGEIQKKNRYKGHDLEGICYLRDTLWSVDETHRRMVAFNPKTLEILNKKQYPLSGALNEGWESVCPDLSSEGLVLFTEKSPLRVFQFNSNWEINLIKKLKYPKEIAGACVWKGAYWVVSDEDRSIYKLNPEDFTIMGEWRIPVMNPEGIFISQKENIWILSDDMHRLYKFDMPQQ